MQIMTFANKSYYYQIRNFVNLVPNTYMQLSIQPVSCVYFFKEGNPNIIVRADSVSQKVHGWAIRQLEILEKKNCNPVVQHWRSEFIDFKSQVIISLLQTLNTHIALAIFDQCKMSDCLRKWLSEPITDVFLVNRKSVITASYECSFLQIKTLYHLRYQSYLQTKAWRGQTWTGLVDIAHQEKILKSQNYADVMSEVIMLIKQYPVLESKVYTNMWQIMEENAKEEEKQTQIESILRKAREEAVLKKYRLLELLD